MSDNPNKTAPTSTLPNTAVVHEGKRLVLPGDPSPMKYDDAIAVLLAQKKADNEMVRKIRNLDCLPWDGALALAKALHRKYGWVHTKPTMSFFGQNPPQVRNVPGPEGTTIETIWGQFQLVQFEGSTINCGVHHDRGVPGFQLVADCKRLYGEEMVALFDLVAQIAQEESIYKGRAFNVDSDADGDLNIDSPPTFMNVKQVDRRGLIFSKLLEEELQANLFSMIEYTEVALAAGVPLRRGILLEGPYGTGKSLTALTTAKLCSENGWTFMNVQNPLALAKVIRWSKYFGKVVIFCEDIDRTMSGERTLDKDELLNIIDGVQGKHDDVILVLTTNHVENINPAMLRPGRFDAVISVQAPDAEAATRLIEHYAGGALEGTHDDLLEAGEKLAGRIPAVIAEVVKRSKLFSIKRAVTEGKTGGQIRISPSDIILSAESMTKHLELLYGKKHVPTAAENLFSAMSALVKTSVEDIEEKDLVPEIREKVDYIRRRI
jgi:transitional endoplasmic reticulum ATPase